MTSIPVNNVNALLTYVNQAGNAGARTDEEAVQMSFDKVMGKLSDEVANLKAPEVSSAKMTVNTVKAAESAPKKQNATGESQMKQTDKADGSVQDNATQADDTPKSVDEADAGAAEAVRESGEQLVEDVAEEMDVTVEEVEEAMAVLGLTVLDLFEPDNMKQLLLQISDSTDQLSLVTDETLYTSLQNLLTTAEELLTDLGGKLNLTEEEVDALVTQLAAVPAESDVSADTAVSTAPDETVQEGREEQKVNLEGMKDYAVTVNRDGETVRVKVTVDDANGTKSVQEEVTDVAKTTVHADVRSEYRGASEQGRNEDGKDHAFMHASLLPQPEHTETAPVAETPVYQPAQTPETSQIMDQIMEYMRINVRPDVQEMELQLHPASLGTVNVQIASKEGAITAQFTTQNEIVRAAVESQLVQLKTQFEEQGIKVDAVEVTVATHQDGQQFAQADGQAERNRKGSGKTNRRLNLDEIEDEESLEEMDDSEKIAVEMMRQNGGTVDYMA